MSWWKLWERDAPKPNIATSRTSRAEPLTSLGLGGSPVTDRAKVFDPALHHFGKGVVPGDPPFETPEQLAEWRQLQLRVMGHVLEAIAASPSAEHLVLRGSALMCAWFGEAARPPKDLDFVVVPETLSIHDKQASALLEAIVAAVTSRPCAGVELRRDEVAIDDIWTYARVPGNRLVFRWTAEGKPWGSTQLDFVFGERMLEPAETLEVRLGRSPGVTLRVAPKRLSLAWKLLWMHTDNYPRGKDLYDAMLLAEATTLPRPLLEAVFQSGRIEAPSPERLTEFDDNGFEWIGFEQPDPTTVEAWRSRLKMALLR